MIYMDCILLYFYFAEYCHFDPDDGLLVVLQGHKQVRLFGCDLESLYPNTLGSKGRTVQATVNCEQPDLDAHPKFRQAICSYTQLNPGDMYVQPSPNITQQFPSM